MNSEPEYLAPIAQLADVSFSYDGVRPILCEMSVSLLPGRVYALIGPNGAGKSTLVGVLAGLLEPTRGRVTVAGQSSASERRRACAVVQQHLSLFPDLSVSENLLLGVVPRGFGLQSRDASSSHATAKHLLDAIEADLPLDARCGDLSFPARQKIEIARALARRPRILCLDEPTSALDLAGKRALFTALQRLTSGGTTVLLVTHDPSDVKDAEAIPLYVAGGRFVQEDSAVRAPSSIGAAASSRVSTRTADTRALELRFVNELTNTDASVLVTPGDVSLAVFDDALERSEAVTALLGASSSFRAHVRGATIRSWQALPDAFVDLRIRVISGSKQDLNVFPDLSIQENAVLLSALHGGSRLRSRELEAALVESLRCRGGVTYPSPSARFREMSGGNQQRLLLAASVASTPDLLVVEEPLMGVDERSLRSIARILWDYAANGGRVLVPTCFPEVYRSWPALTVEIARRPELAS